MGKVRDRIIRAIWSFQELGMVIEESTVEQCADNVIGDYHGDEAEALVQIEALLRSAEVATEHKLKRLYLLEPWKRKPRSKPH
jgi:hypothetical protein